MAELEGVKPSASGWVQFLPGAAVGFSLSPQVAAASAFCQIDFGAILDAPPSSGVLWLDYGGGFSRGSRVQLTPMSRLRYGAIVATAGLKRLKWEPTSAGGEILPILLTARPVTFADVEERMRTNAGRAASTCSTASSPRIMIEGIHPATIRHIPQVLYHWRMTEGSTALGAQQKNYAAQAGLNAIADHLEQAPRFPTRQGFP